MTFTWHTNDRCLNVSISSLVTDLQNFNLCPGLPQSLASFATDPVGSLSQVTRHTIPLCPELYCDKGIPYQVSMFLRCYQSTMLIPSDEDACVNCIKVVASEAKKAN